MLNPIDTEKVSDLFYLLDKGVRHDLSKDAIADERDYVSRLVYNFNYPFGVLNQFVTSNMKLQSKWFARVNSGSNERTFGCDSMIVFQVEDQFKIGLFEAKWPRVIKDPDYLWDLPIKKTGESHFTNQIKRQENWSDQAAIWEMFFYELPVGETKGSFDKFGSTCVKHEFASAYISGPDKPAATWNNDHLEKLIKITQSSGDPANLHTMVSDILSCKFGTPLDKQKYESSITLTSTKTSEEVAIPIPNFFDEREIPFDNNNDQEIIDYFMRSTGLSFFQFLKIVPSSDQSEED